MTQQPIAQTETPSVPLRDPTVGVIALVPNPWGGIWQPREHVLTRLSRHFQVVWCDPLRGRRALWNAAPPIEADIPLDGSFEVIPQRRWLPVIGRIPGFERALWKAHLRRARNALIRRGAKRIVLYLWRPRFAPALDLVSHDLSVYHIDDEYKFTATGHDLGEQEKSLLGRVDQVFIHSKRLLERKGHLNPSTAWAPNGVDYDAYATPVPEPDDLRDIPHPRIGYVGRIKWQLDIALMLELARRFPGMSFVFVGPVGQMRQHEEAFRQFAELANVHLIPERPFDVLPSYMQHLDVCLLCYDISDYTNNIYPMKLHEYLATGRPVIGTPIHSLLEFGDVVRLGRDVDEWSAALEACVHEIAASGERERRQAVAARHDWGLITENIARTLDERLASRRTA